MSVLSISPETYELPDTEPELKTPNLSFFARVVEERYNDPDFCEWLGNEVVSRYFSYDCQRVDLDASRQANSACYLSITQMEALSAMPDEELVEHYSNNLSVDQIAFIGRYRQVYHPDVILPPVVRVEPIVFRQLPDEQLPPAEVITPLPEVFEIVKEPEIIEPIEDFELVTEFIADAPVADLQIPVIEIPVVDLPFIEEVQQLERISEIPEIEKVRTPSTGYEVEYLEELLKTKRSFKQAFSFGLEDLKLRWADLDQSAKSRIKAVTASIGVVALMSLGISSLEENADSDNRSEAIAAPAPETDLSPEVEYRLESPESAAPLSAASIPVLSNPVADVDTASSSPSTAETQPATTTPEVAVATTVADNLETVEISERESTPQVIEELTLTRSAAVDSAKVESDSIEPEQKQTEVKASQESTSTQQSAVRTNASVVEKQLNNNQSQKKATESNSGSQADQSATEQTQTSQQSSAEENQAPVEVESNTHEADYSLTDQQTGWLQAAGIAESDWEHVDFIVTRESSWRYDVWNMQGSSAYGLCQTMLSIHDVPDGFMDSPAIQLKWCDNYAKQRYGGWKKAAAAHARKNWW